MEIQSKEDINNKKINERETAKNIIDKKENSTMDVTSQDRYSNKYSPSMKKKVFKKRSSTIGRCSKTILDKNPKNKKRVKYKETGLVEVIEIECFKNYNLENMFQEPETRSQSVNCRCLIY